MAAELRVGIGADTSKLTQGLERAKAQINAFSSGQLKSIGGTIAGAFTVGAITSLASEAIALGGKFDDLSKRTGLSAEELQRLDYAAKQNGSSIEALVGSLQKLAVARQNAMADPNSEVGKAFADLKIDPSKSVEESFYGIANAVRDMNAAQDHAASMTALLGRSFGELVPMMAEGGEALKNLGKEFRGLVSNEDIAKLDRLGDAIDRLKANATATFATRGVGVAEAWTRFGEGWLRDIKKGGTGFLTAGWTGFFDALIGTTEIQKPKPKGRAPGGAGGEPPISESERKARANVEASNMEKRIRQEENDNLARANAMMKRDEESRREQAKYEEFQKDQQLAIAGIKDGKGISISNPLTDNLARIGGFVGGKADPGLRLVERQVRIQEEIIRYLRDHPWKGEGGASDMD